MMIVFIEHFVVAVILTSTPLPNHPLPNPTHSRPYSPPILPPSHQAQTPTTPLSR